MNDILTGSLFEESIEKIIREIQDAAEKRYLKSEKNLVILKKSSF